jgi:hypothetical protein
LRNERFEKNTRLIWAIIVVGWLFALTAAYFWAHKPFNSAVVLGLGRSVVSILFWLSVIGLAAALGRRLWGGLLADESPLTRLALSAGVGLGVLSLLILGLGLLSLLRSWTVWGMLIVLTLLLRRQLMGVLRDVRRAWSAGMRPQNPFQYLLAIYGGVRLSFSFLEALTPPTSWDTLVYHLTGPRLYVDLGRVAHPIDLPYLGFPQLGQMQFTLGLLTIGDGPASLFHFGYGILALVITGSLAARYFGPRAAWLAGGILLSVPTLFSLMSRAYVDVTLLFYATGALYVLLRWREEKETRWLWLLGLLLGFCGGIKYTAVAIPFAMVLSILWISRREGWRVGLGRVSLVAGVAVVSVLPWLIENALTTGNPVYPFLLSTGRYWDAWRRWWYDRPGTGLAAKAPWRLLVAPLEATVLGTEGTSRYDATIGPLLLGGSALLPLIWRTLRRGERAVVGHLLSFCGAGYLLWLTGLARTSLLLQTRLLLPVFGAVSVIGGLAFEKLEHLNSSKLDVAWIARAVIVLTLSLSLFSGAIDFLKRKPLRFIVGLESREEYLTRRLGGHFVVLDYLNHEMPDDATVLFLWEPRSYYCTIDCRPDALLDRWLHHTYRYGPNSAAIADAWRERGVTHILLHRMGYDMIREAKFDPLHDEDASTLSQLIQQELTLLEEVGGTYEVYALTGEQ